MRPQMWLAKANFAIIDEIMGRHRNSRPQRTTWDSLKSSGSLSERHVLMATGLGMEAETIGDQHRSAPETQNLLFLEWVEDLYYAKFGTYSPVDERATPADQEEHPAENTLLQDPCDIMDKHIQQRREQIENEGGDTEITDEELSFEAQEIIEHHVRETPVSYGEINEEDREMLKRQEDFRKAARALTRHLAEIPAVRRVVLFGSTVLPLWKEVPRFARLRKKQIKIYHEVGNIDLAVWVAKPFNADQLRKTMGSTVNELVQKEVYLSVASHHFSIHLIEQNTVAGTPGLPSAGRYLGMVCHYKKCPNQKPECFVDGCGAVKHVRILPWFNLKPHRLNTHNSQVLYDAEAKP